MLLWYAPILHGISFDSFLADGGIFVETSVKEFVGGNVVLETVGLTTLIISIFLRPLGNKEIPPHNPGYVMISVAMNPSADSI